MPIRLILGHVLSIISFPPPATLFAIHPSTETLINSVSAAAAVEQRRT